MRPRPQLFKVDNSNFQIPFFVHCSVKLLSSYKEYVLFLYELKHLKMLRFII